jgi:hypothetical protein
MIARERLSIAGNKLSMDSWGTTLIFKGTRPMIQNDFR